MKVVLIGLILAVVAAGGGFWWWSQQVLPPRPGDEQKQAFVVAKDATANQIIDQLYQQGLVKSPLATKIFLYAADRERRLQAGSFVLTRGLTLTEVIGVLTGPATDVWVTIPEGWRREQIAARLEANLQGPLSQFNPAEFLNQTATLEGQLFPDTYLIPAAATAADTVRILTANFAAKSGLQLPHNRQELVMASLVEREGKTDTDRPVISGILWKRLKSSWPLQVDASTQYGRDTVACKSQLLTCDYWQPVTDSHYPTAYNTYLSPGLPPGPIANPGRAAIAATLDPQESEYWFYLHAPDGSVHYAVTPAQHAANIDKYLKQ